MTGPAAAIQRAVDGLRQGEPIVVYDADDREGEADLIYAAATVTPESVARLRNDAGGLICVALSFEVAEAFGLPYLHNSIDHPTSEKIELEYDDRSSFSLSVNHRETYTGVTDKDRARTISALADAAARPAETDFGATFHSPGHVSILKAAPNGLADRLGHTEIAVKLVQAAGHPPAGVVCEMLDDETGEALSKRKARQYATEHGFAFLEGADVVTQYC